MKILRSLIFLSSLVGAIVSAHSQNPKFHIFVCIGQSNMEGNASIEAVDTVGIPDNFRVMAAADFSKPARSIGEWYAAVPPLVRQHTGLTPMDYFGRTMVANLPEDHRVGVVPVAVGGCKIEHLSKSFDPLTLEHEADWFKAFMSEYDNNPYRRLIECLRKAQKSGIISGILIHQGESNTGDSLWCNKVKTLYDDILADLSLAPNSVPLFAGEVVSTEMGGQCGSMNRIIDALPLTLPMATVVSSEGLEQRGDGLHFTARSYRVLGCRFAAAVLASMGITNPTLAYNDD